MAVKLYDWFMAKSVGGRGKRAENKYERFTVTAPPELLVRLDEYAAARDISRSEAFALLVDKGLKFSRATARKQVISVSRET